ncbi:MAG TPA: hypothetical protein VGE21_01305 [Flavobacteriales bacterium]
MFDPRNIATWIVILLLSAGGAWIVGHVPGGEPEAPLAITVSVGTAEPGTLVRLSYRDGEGKVQGGEQRTPYAPYSTLIFALPTTPSVDSLAVEILSPQPAHVAGIGLVSGAYIGAFSSDVLAAQARLEHCTAGPGTTGGLHLVPVADRSRFVLDQPILLDQDLFQWMWAVVAFVLLFGTLVYLQRRYAARSFLPVAATALLLAALFGEALYSLCDRVDSADLIVQGSTRRKGPATVEVYYSPDGLYRPDKLISNGYDGGPDGRLELPLPDGVHRGLRLDLPPGDTVTVRSVELRLWPYHLELEGKELLAAFPLLNDLTAQLGPDGAATFITGTGDPHAHFSHREHQTRFALFQAKKRQYAHWMALLFFLLVLWLLLATADRRHIVFTIAFLTCLSLPLVTLLFKEEDITLFTEKRLAHQKPQKWRGMKGSADEATAYANDQFGGRKRLTTTWNVLKVLSFGQTSHSSMVVVGKDGWLFYTGEGVQEMYENKNPYSEEQLRKMCAVVEERRQWLALYGIEYYLLIPPLKEDIYGEYLPARIKRRNALSKLDQFLAHMKEHSTAQIIDLRPVLAEARRKEKLPIYYSVDTHWNLLGAHYGYKALMERIRADHPELPPSTDRDDYVWEQSESEEGDLSQLLSMGQFFPRPEIVPVPLAGYAARTVPSVKYPTYVSPHDVQTRETADTTLMRLVMNRDSYANFLMPFLSEHFARSVYLWTPLFNPEIIKEERPDVVVSEMLERFIGDLAIENPPMMRMELDSAAARTSVP